MKQNLRILTSFFLILFSIKGNAQLTKLANNNNIKYGVPLGSIGVLADKNGALWRTDGTPAGTLIYTSKVLIDSTVQLAILNNKIYFTGITASSGRELWVTDGTDGGTQLVKDIQPGTTSSSPRALYVFNNTIYFFAKTTSDGVELWKSDGTSTGTVEVKDINPGAGNSYNGTYTSFFSNNNVLYFNAYDGVHGIEPWKTNGTTTGTVILQDINPGSDSSNCQEFTALGTDVIFSADDGTHGVELWKTNGTTTGLVQDIVSGANGSSPQQFVAFNNKLFFLTISGTFPLIQYNLYLTDGTGATLVKSFGVGGFALLINSVIINNKIYFSASSLTSGFELWSSDGTTAGTTVFDNINPVIGMGSNPFILPDFLSFINGGNYHTHLYNGKIFFIADDGTHGAELWITDGTVAGTKMVTDLNPGADSSLLTGSGSISWFYTTSDFYFTANNGTTGTELFKTNGTEAGTSLVKDINPGSASSDPFMFMFLNNHIYLTADDGDNVNGDVDLYLINAEVSLPVSLLSFTATLNNKAVDLQWTTSTETNTKNYTIQRSYNGAQFENIGSQAAAGNSDKKINYLFTDKEALNTGVNKIYYRLQITDNDGKFTYSPIAAVTISSNGSFIVLYPNPVKDQLILVTNISVNKATVKISNAGGKVVYIKQFENIQPGAQNKINVAGLGKGVYYLEFISDNNKQTTRFIKF